MRWLLDTNVVVDAFGGEAAAVKMIKDAHSAKLEWIGFSAITRLEVLGFSGLTQSDEQGLRELLEQFNEVAVTAEIIDEAIRIRRSIRIKTPDAIIAATALVQKSSLVTRNIGDFKTVQGLQLIHVKS